MRKRVLGLLSVMIGLSAFGQKDPVVMAVGDEQVTISEFSQIFFKNYKKSTVSKEDLDEYLVLFERFKLKVLEAKSRGMDEDPKFKKELEGYRKQLVRPYMADKEMNQQLVDEAYERMKTEVRASHIMVRCDENAAPEDTLVAYNKAMNIWARVIENEQSFEEIAKGKGGSEDPSAQSNGGDLGFFTAFDMVYPFESAVYEMEVGEVTDKPVRTRYGYHIIKKTDERPARGEIRAAHILIANDPNNTENPEGESKINEIYKLLQDGGEFSELAKKYSDDKKFGMKGGELPRFGTGKMIPEFEEVAFSLKNDGDYSKPFKTSFGWHIVKRLEYFPIPSKEEALSSIETKIKRDTRSNKSKVSFLAKLKKQYNFTETGKHLQAVDLLDTNIFEGKWENPGSTDPGQIQIFSFADKKYTLDDFLSYLESKQRRQRPVELNAYVEDKYKFYVDGEITAYEESQLETKYPEFAALMKEYEEGILLFEITEQEVWGKAQKDSAGLAQFYEAHKNEFMWKDRVEAEIYRCDNAKTAKLVRKLVKKNKTPKEIMDKVNADSKLKVSRESGKFERDSREFLAEVKKGVSKPIKSGENYYVVSVLREMPAGPKLLNEARGPIIAKYQEQLEEEWIKELKSKYTVKVNKDVLYTLIKE